MIVMNLGFTTYDRVAITSNVACHCNCLFGWLGHFSWSLSSKCLQGHKSPVSLGSCQFVKLPKGGWLKDWVGIGLSWTARNTLSSLKVTYMTNRRWQRKWQGGCVSGKTMLCNHAAAAMLHMEYFMILWFFVILCNTLQSCCCSNAAHGILNAAVMKRLICKFLKTLVNNSSSLCWHFYFQYGNEIKRFLWMTEAYLLWLISAHFHLNICPSKTFTCKLVRQNICICICICITVDNVS